MNYFNRNYLVDEVVHVFGDRQVHQIISTMLNSKVLFGAYKNNDNPTVVTLNPTPVEEGSAVPVYLSRQLKGEDNFLPARALISLIDDFMERLDAINDDTENQSYIPPVIRAAIRDRMKRQVMKIAKNEISLDILEIDDLMLMDVPVPSNAGKTGKSVLRLLYSVKAAMNGNPDDKDGDAMDALISFLERYPSKSWFPSRIIYLSDAYHFVTGKVVKYNIPLHANLHSSFDDISMRGLFTKEIAVVNDIVKKDTSNSKIKEIDIDDRYIDPNMNTDKQGDFEIDIDNAINDTIDNPKQYYTRAKSYLRKMWNWILINIFKF